MFFVTALAQRRQLLRRPQANVAVPATPEAQGVLRQPGSRSKARDASAFKNERDDSHAVAGTLDQTGGEQQLAKETKR